MKWHFVFLTALFLAPLAWAQNWGLVAIEKEPSLQLIKKANPIVVAVIDTGIDPFHPALKNSLWKNPGETGKDRNGLDKATNGLDDDGNGFIDDVNGWNFVSDDGDLTDRHGHGTHIAGLIAAESKDPLRGGVAPGVQLMILKYYDPHAKGADNLRALIRAIRYATAQRARIINYSGGGFVASLEEKQAIAEAGRQNILFVAAAGNESVNSDKRPFYPADYALPHILSVGGHDSQNRWVASSNYGARSVDLAAPGAAIVSTLPGGWMGPLTGTSQATAFVTGAAALLMSQRPDWKDPARLIAHLRESSKFEQNFVGRSKTEGRLSLLKALALQDAGRTFSGFRLRLDSSPRQ
jgi:subtilisin family serine protease